MEKKYSFSTLLVLILFSVLTCVAVLCMVFLSYLQQLHDVSVNEGISGDFNELLEIVSTQFIGSYDEYTVVEEAKRTVIDSLDDNWSYYMTPDEYSEYLQNSDNRYHGIGVEVIALEDESGIEVRNVYRESGAFAAGIVVGDIITAIDGESIHGFTIPEVRNALRRELGDTVVLTVLRRDGLYHDITVIYSVIFKDPVSYEMLDDNIGYVLLENFESGSAESFINAVNTLIEQGAVAIIYDVRSNFGGKVHEMTAILDFLLPEGEIFIAVNRNGEEHITRSDAKFIDLPTVVLVNSYSFSGAEYFTVTLSEYGYAHTVGEQTTGKNRMQTTHVLSGGGAVHISTGMYLTPNRISLYDVGGYTPDFEIPLSEDELSLLFRGELNREDDPQFQKAIELLKDRV